MKMLTVMMQELRRLNPRVKKARIRRARGRKERLMVGMMVGIVNSLKLDLMSS